MLSNENATLKIEGHLKVFDPVTGQVFVNQRNAIKP